MVEDEAKGKAVEIADQARKRKTKDARRTKTK